jgi:hypothetical protein
MDDLDAAQTYSRNFKEFCSARLVRVLIEEMVG